LRFAPTAACPAHPRATTCQYTTSRESGTTSVADAAVAESFRLSNVGDASAPEGTRPAEDKRG
jgi:hypothetical protein